jgi:hypothetical protein
VSASAWSRIQTSAPRARPARTWGSSPTQPPDDRVLPELGVQLRGRPSRAPAAGGRGQRRQRSVDVRPWSTWLRSAGHVVRPATEVGCWAGIDTRSKMQRALHFGKESGRMGTTVPEHLPPRSARKRRDVLTAARAVSPRTVYNHFEGKDRLVATVLLASAAVARLREEGIDRTLRDVPVAVAPERGRRVRRDAVGSGRRARPLRPRGRDPRSEPGAQLRARRVRRGRGPAGPGAAGPRRPPHRVRGSTLRENLGLRPAVVRRAAAGV